MSRQGLEPSAEIKSIIHFASRLGLMTFFYFMYIFNNSVNSYDLIIKKIIIYR